MPVRASGTGRSRRLAVARVAAEKRGAKVKKKLEVDPLHAETVQLIFKLALQGNGQSGLMRVKARRTRDANATKASLKRSGGGSQRAEG